MMNNKYNEILEILDSNIALDKEIIDTLEVFKEDFLVLTLVERILFRHYGTSDFIKSKICLLILLTLFMVELATGQTEVDFNLQEIAKQFNINIEVLKEYLADGLDIEFIYTSLLKNDVYRVKMINPLN